MRYLTIRTGAALAALTALAACKSLDVPNYTSASIELLEGNPTPAAINNTATGMLRSARGDQATGGVVEQQDVFARNAYNLDPSEVRNVTIPLIGPLDPTQGATSFGPYNTVRQGYEILAAVDKVGAAMTDQQKEGVRGFAKTIMAWDFHTVVRQTDIFGAPVDVNRDRSGPLAPVVNQAAVYAQIEKLLDEADTHLSNAGTSFSFALSAGFSKVGNFATPAAFRQFNRALKARVLADEGKYATVLTTLPGSFINTNLTAANALTVLNTGVYHSYSSLSGDVANGLADPTGRAHLAHPSLVTDAQFQPGGVLKDDRLIRKVDSIATTRTLQGVSSKYIFKMYLTADSSVAWIRNEELILLRAEAKLQTGDRTGALADINLIRQFSGKLAVLAADPGAGGTFSGDLLRDELLYNMRYSLVYEYGHRWVELRKYGLLAKLPKQQTLHVIFERRPFPQDECNQRTGENLAACKSVQGL